MLTVPEQIAWLFILPIAIACVSWTVTHAEIFREAREYFTARAHNGKTIFERKFFFLLICDYCFSHYVTILFLIITKYRLLIDDWRGYMLAFFSVVWIANIYMNLFTFLRLKYKSIKTTMKIAQEEHHIKQDDLH